VPGGVRRWSGTAGVGPLGDQRAVVAFELAIGLGPVGAGAREPDPQPRGGLGEHHRVGVGLGVVVKHPLQPHALLGEERGRLGQEPRRGLAALVVVDGAVGHPEAVVDQRVDVLIAHGCSVSAALGATKLAVATAGRDAPQLLDVQVGQLAGVLAAVAHRHAGGRSVSASRLRPWRRSTP
jgi:hypothetical protein